MAEIPKKTDIFPGLEAADRAQGLDRAYTTWRLGLGSRGRGRMSHISVNAFTFEAVSCCIPHRRPPVLLRLTW